MNPVPMPLFSQVAWHKPTTAPLQQSPPCANRTHAPIAPMQVLTCSGRMMRAQTPLTWQSRAGALAQQRHCANCSSKCVGQQVYMSNNFWHNSKPRVSYVRKVPFTTMSMQLIFMSESLWGAHLLIK